MGLWAGLKTSRRWRGALVASGLAIGAAVVVVGPSSPVAAQLTGLPQGFVDELVVGGLPFPTAVAFAPTGTTFVALKRGEVRVYDGATALGTFVDISARVHDNHDRGLLGLAVHPEFPEQPYIYLLYTHDDRPTGVAADLGSPVQGRTSQLLRVTADPSPSGAPPYTRAIAGSEVVLLGTNSVLANIGNPNDGRNTSTASCMSPKNMSGTPVEDCIPSDENSHTIGTVTFAPDGSLLVSSGDGSNYSAVDPRAMRAQLLDSLAGKVLRIDPITGLGMPDNPYYDPANPNRNRSKVYASGLRNPFRITVEPVSGEAFIGDVGWNTWEEINTGKGANFGWPCYEGGSTITPESGSTSSLQQSSYRTNTATSAACASLYGQGVAAVRAPTFAYNHAAGGASANAGAFYGGTTWPAQYQRALFIADYNRAWIRYLTFDAQGRATVNNFGTASTGPVQMLVGPDTNLYWMMYSSTGGQLRRIRYTGAGNTPPTAIVDATPTVGLTPLTVAFDADASFDPDAQALDYAWNFGDGAVSATKNPTHVYTAAGVYDATLTVTERTAPFASSTATVRITVGNNPPLAEILAPSDGAAYRIGDTISFAGRATAGGIPLPASQLTWELRNRHNEHVHYSTPVYGADPVDPTLSGGSFPVDEHGDNTSFAVCLTATVDAELADTRCVELVPETVDITIDSEPSGMLVSYEDEGLELATPGIVSPIVGSTQTVSLETIQQSRTFVGWSDGVTSPSRTFTAGATPATYTALFENSPPVASIAALDPATGEAPLTVRFSATASGDAEGDLLTYAWDAGAAGTSTSATPTFTFDTAGSHTVALTVTDQLGATDTASTTVTVTASNQPPVAGDDQVDITEDTTVTIDVLANDTDADDGTLSVQSVTGAAAGTTAINPAGTVSYVPNANACGTDTFSYTVADARGAVDTATVNVDVACTNDAPTVATPDRSTPEGTAITLSASGADVDDAPAELSYSWTPATLLSDPSSRTPTMTAPDNRATTYTVTVCDPQGACASDTSVVTVTNVTPGVTLGADVTVGSGEIVQFQAALTDAGADDLTLSVAWGDGVTELVGGRGPHVLAHTYATPGSYNVQACVTDDDGAGSCDTAQATVQGLPAPWSWTGVGAVTAPGSASYGAGTFTVVNQGPPIDGRADGLTFVHQQRNGNVEIIARVGSLTNTGAKASAGIMIRNSLSAGSPFVAVHVLARGGVLLDTRSAEGAKITGFIGPKLPPPRWLRIVRTGDVFSAYQSADGSTWALVATRTIDLTDSTRVGLVASSANTSRSATATFTNVTVTFTSVTVT